MARPQTMRGPSSRRNRRAVNEKTRQYRSAGPNRQPVTMVYLVHHGDAHLPEIDPRRPLSARGLEAVRALADQTARRGARPACIWHSGKLRARQTAEAFWRACNPFATFSAERGLQPTDPPEWMRDRLSGEQLEIMLVGHLPNLPRLL